MSLASPSSSQLRAQIGALLRKDPDARVVGLRVRPDASYPSTLHVEDRAVRCVPCPSTLAVREALVEQHGDRDDVLLILTDRADHELGSDVLARLARHRVLEFQTWHVLMELFSARLLDRRLAGEKWLADALLDAVPIGGFPPAPGGVLDVELAFTALVRATYGLDDPAPDLPALLRWAADPTNAGRLQLTEPTLRDLIVGMLREKAGPGAGVALDVIVDGRAADLVPLGLVCQVLADGGTRPPKAISSARIRMEPLLCGRRLDGATAQAWGDAAVAVLDAADEADVRRWWSRAEAILDEIQAGREAWRSPQLPKGFDQRLDRFAAALESALAEGSDQSLAQLENARSLVLGHVLAGERVRANRPVREGVDMAVRLARRLMRNDPAPGKFRPAAAMYVDDGSWVDYARDVLSIGDANARLSAAYTALLARVSKRREAENRNFAQRLTTGWMPNGAGDLPILPIHAIVADVVGPIAARIPVLFLVADGMSLSVARDLLGEAARSGWRELAPDGAERMAVGVAVAPSVTRVSRASLFAGEVVDAPTANAEAKAFAAHPALAKVTSKAKAPTLFHKVHLSSRAGEGLTDDVRAAIEDVDRRVVAAVVNAIDDQLERGDEAVGAWRASELPLFRHLFDAARLAGRVLILTSDHGHILDRANGEYRKVADTGAGNRWRHAGTGAVADDEIELAGPTVCVPDGPVGGPVVVATNERLRYGPKKAGYHGGATPQEMLVPIAVLAYGPDPVDGWADLGSQEPDWWVSDGGVPSDTKPPAQAPLFDTGPAGRGKEPDATEPAWIKSLAKTKLWKDQLAAARRGQISDEQARRALRELSARGGTMTTEAFARATCQPVVRVDGFLSHLRKVLNVDGYAVLNVEAESVRLDEALLRLQFGIEADT